VSETRNFEKPFGDVQRMQSKAQYYLSTDPEVTLMFARKAAEAVLKIIFVAKISENVGGMMLEKLIEQLTNGKHLPKHVLPHVRTIQVLGNFGAHDQEADNQAITTGYALPCIHSLDYLCDWFTKTYIPSAPVSEPQAEITSTGSIKAHTPAANSPKLEDVAESRRPTKSAIVPKPKLQFVDQSNEKLEITLHPPFKTSKVAEAFGIKVFKLIGDLIEFRVFATAEKVLDADLVIKIATKYGYISKPS